MNGDKNIFSWALAGAVLLYVASRTQRCQDVAGDVVGALAEAEPGELRGTLDNVLASISGKLDAALSAVSAAGSWLAKVPARLKSVFESAGARYGLPDKLLERVAYQESRFREDIISGQTVSSAGALGIMQIVPKWHPGVDPLDAAASIEYAAGYLKKLYSQFGSWKLALAAYNWGPGNLQKDLQDKIIGNEWPAETRRYVADISADVGLA